MKGIDEFLFLFGDITVSQIVTLLLAIAFIVYVCKQVRDYFIKKYEAEKVKDEQLKEALTAVRKYPEYREQSIKIQQLLEGEIQELRVNQKELMERLVQMEEERKVRDRNKLRDILLQNYRYYTNKETNPSQTWSRMESEAFWELFKDYENAGGNGYMRSTVMPAMEDLMVVEVGPHHSVF